MDCPSTQICVVTDCVPAYGRDYSITIYGATGIQEANPSGEAWDFPGGLPDPFIVFYVDDDAWHTATAQDTLSPTWNSVISPVRINVSTHVRWEMWDEDLTTHDAIVGYWGEASAFQLPVEAIRNGGWTNEGEGIEVVFFIDPL